MRSEAGSSLLRRCDSPLAAAAIVAVAYAAFVGLRLAKHGGDPSAFVTAGDEFCDPARVPAGLRVLRDSPGYDGQYYYRLALDPFTSRPVDFGIRLDTPPYRQQRILYPLVVWALSLGQPARVPALMITVNLLGLCGIGWIAASYARAMGRHALWGLLVPFYPGFVLTLARDLAEILELCLLLAALLATQRDRPRMAGVLLALAVLAKETALVPALAVVGVAAWRAAGRRRAPAQPHYQTFLLPLLTYVVWQALLYLRWGQWPVLAGRGNLGLPVVGLAGFLRTVLGRAGGYHDLWLAELIFLALFATCTLVSLRRTAAPAAVRVAWVLYALLGLSLTRSVWAEDWAFLRALSEFYVLGAIILIGGASRVNALLGVYVGFAWVVVMRLARH